jgi:hypothetical protein
LHERAKPAECVVQCLLVHHGVQIPDEELGADFDALLLVGRSLVDADGLAEEAHLVHDFGGIFGVFFCLELDEAIALMGLGDSVFRQMDVNDATSLEHELPYQWIGNALVEIPNIDGGFFILLPSSKTLACARWRIAQTDQCLKVAISAMVGGNSEAGLGVSSSRLFSRDASARAFLTEGTVTNFSEVVTKSKWAMRNTETSLQEIFSTQESEPD